MGLVARWPLGTTHAPGPRHRTRATDAPGNVRSDVPAVHFPFRNIPVSIRGVRERRKHDKLLKIQPVAKPALLVDTLFNFNVTLSSVLQSLLHLS